jgi:ribose/xylose/arabinose/galactoside ABC-type transport system permease subunit
LPASPQKQAKPSADAADRISISKRARFFDALDSYRGIIAFVEVFILGVVFSPKSLTTGMPVFLSVRTQLDILYEYAEYGLLATGMTLVILSGGIDLSVIEDYESMKFY